MRSGAGIFYGPTTNTGPNASSVGALTYDGQADGGSKAIQSELIEKGRNIDLQGRVTPDGRLFVFYQKTGGLAVRDLRTGAVKRLADEAKSNMSREGPIPSRDGKMIAYKWNGQLRVIHVDGSGMRTVLENRSRMHLVNAPERPRLGQTQVFVNSRGRIRARDRSRGRTAAHTSSSVFALFLPAKC